jgi:hypothetical protein
VLWALSLFTVVFLVAPTVFVTFPPSGVTLHWYRQVAGEFAAATWLSVQLASASMIVSIVLGLPAAYALVRGRPRGGDVLDALFRSPLQIPHVVIGIGFLQYYLLIARASGIELLSTSAALSSTEFDLRGRFRRDDQPDPHRRGRTSRPGRQAALSRRRCRGRADGGEDAGVGQRDGWGAAGGGAGGPSRGGAVDVDVVDGNRDGLAVPGDV